MESATRSEVRDDTVTRGWLPPVSVLPVLPQHHTPVCVLKLIEIVLDITKKRLSHIVMVAPAYSNIGSLSSAVIKDSPVLGRGCPVAPAVLHLHIPRDRLKLAPL